MKRALAALAAALPLSFATAQDASRPHHGAPSAATPAPAAQASTDPGPAALYRSAFRDYRPFSEEVPPRDWRKANDEVRDAGGHVGLMKEGAASDAHGAHGAKPPPSGERK